MPNIAAVHFSYYPQDVRPRREAEALTEAGMSVDVICLRKGDQPSFEIVNGVSVHRISMQKIRSGKLSYISQYLVFIVLAGVKLTGLYIRNRYDIVHVHNMPDILVFVALLPKLCGSRIILDLHDPMPELYMTKYGIHDNHQVIRLLKLLERWSIRFADSVITPNISFRNRFISRGCPEEKICIVMNSPMEIIFNNDGKDADRPGDHRADRFVLMFHGSVFERHGLDTALEAVASLRHEIPNLEFHVFGDGDYVDQFLKLIEEKDLGKIVKFGGEVPLEVIKSEIMTIDVGVIPNKISPFTNINLPTRIFEYLSLRKPVIVPKTEGISDYFDEESLFFFDGGNAQSLSDVIMRIYRDPICRQEVTGRGVAVYHRHTWSLQRQALLAVVNGQLGG